MTMNGFRDWGRRIVVSTRAAWAMEWVAPASKTERDSISKTKTDKQTKPKVLSSWGRQSVFPNAFKGRWDGLTMSTICLCFCFCFNPEQTLPHPRRAWAREELQGIEVKDILDVGMKEYGRHGDTAAGQEVGKSFSWCSASTFTWGSRPHGSHELKKFCTANRPIFKPNFIYMCLFMWVN